MAIDRTARNRIGSRYVAVAADMLTSPFGKRSQLYERLQRGEVDRMRLRLYSQYKDPAPAERMMRFIILLY
jgi:aromatic ring hydroxylase